MGGKKDVWLVLLSPRTHADALRDYSHSCECIYNLSFPLLLACQTCFLIGQGSYIFQSEEVFFLSLCKSKLDPTGHTYLLEVMFNRAWMQTGNSQLDLKKKKVYFKQKQLWTLRGKNSGSTRKGSCMFLHQRREAWWPWAKNTNTITNVGSQRNHVTESTFTTKLKRQSDIGDQEFGA